MDHTSQIPSLLKWSLVFLLLIALKYNINKHNMVLFYMLWKKNNEIQLTKTKWT